MVELLFAWMFFAILFAVFSAAIAVSRGRSGVGWFLLGGIFGVFGPLVAALPRIERDADSDRRTVRPSERDDNEWKCPHCAEMVKGEAIKCRFCHSALVPIAPVKKEEPDSLIVRVRRFFEPIEEEEPSSLAAWVPVYVVLLAVLGPLAFVWVFGS